MDKAILVTGYGSIGSIIVRKLLDDGKYDKIIIMDNSESAIHRAITELDRSEIIAIVADISNESDIRRVFNYPIEAVINTAAMKHVTFCESNPLLATTNNIIGINNLLEYSTINKIKKFINISTDKCAYPSNVMGATKFIVERSIMVYDNYSEDTKYQSIRFGNVLFSNGSLIPTVKNIIDNNLELKITDLKATRFFITPKQVANLVTNILYNDYEGQVIIGKLESASLETFLNTILDYYKIDYPSDFNFRAVGLRQGEKLHEHLFTHEEAEYMIDHGDYWSLDFNRENNDTNIKVTDSSQHEINDIKLLDILCREC